MADDKIAAEMDETKNNNPLEAIKAEMEAKISSRDFGMLTLRTANRTLQEAALRPDPVDLYHELWYEGEVCCLFADSNLGKSIYAVQMADDISHFRNVLYVDCELSDKQFQLRYTDSETGRLYQFQDTLTRAEINPAKMNLKNFEDEIIKDIEDAAIVTDSKVIIIDNLTYLCNNCEKGDVAGLFMISLMNLKKKYGWSLLIIAHTPKRSLTSPITQNDLAGSKKLYNFFDSVFAIGKSAKDERLRYVKQVKVRAGAYRYDSDNVILYEIVHDSENVHFEFKGFANEKDHLKEADTKEKNTLEENVMELIQTGKSYRDIASALGISKSLVGNIVKKAESSTTSTVSTGLDKVDSVDSITGKEENDASLF